MSFKFKPALVAILEFESDSNNLWPTKIGIRPGLDTRYTIRYFDHRNFKKKHYKYIYLSENEDRTNRRRRWLQKCDIPTKR